jgi:hypothetical protein
MLGGALSSAKIKLYPSQSVSATLKAGITPRRMQVVIRGTLPQWVIPNLAACGITHVKLGADANKSIKLSPTTATTAIRTGLQT